MFYIFCSKDHKLLDHMEWICWTLKVTEEMPESLNDVKFTIIAITLDLFLIHFWTMLNILSYFIVAKWL